MDSSVVIALVAVALTFMWLGAWLEGARRTFVTKRIASKAAKHGIQSEKDAERFLKKLGYRIVKKQPPSTYWADIDGTRQGVHVTGDFLLKKNGRLLLGEVKTGKAAKFDYENTRRQLLEYQFAFGVEGIVLVDMDDKTVHTIKFPTPVKGSLMLGRPLWKRALPLVAAVVAITAVIYASVHASSDETVHATED